MSLDSESIQSLPWKQLIERVIGVHPKVFDDPSWMVRLTNHMRSENVENVDSYFEYLSESSYRSLQWSRLSHKLLNNTTNFFRHPDSFLYLDEFVRSKFNEENVSKELNSYAELPSNETLSVDYSRSESANLNFELSVKHDRDEIYSSIRKKTKKSFLSIWSVGCSTGEEPYSLSAAIHHSLKKLNKEYLPYSIIASDVSEKAINIARVGRYDPNAFHGDELSNWKGYFDTDQSGMIFAKSCISENVIFFTNSILEKNTFQCMFDVVYCQNLLIYFRRWRAREILNQISESIVVGGVLIVGIGEAQFWSHPNFIRVKNPKVMAFRKIKKHEVI